MPGTAEFFAFRQWVHTQWEKRCVRVSALPPGRSCEPFPVYVVYAQWHRDWIVRMLERIEQWWNHLEMPSTCTLEFVPAGGSYEIPQVIVRVLKPHMFHPRLVGAVGVGIILRGETAHHHLIQASIYRELLEIARAINLQGICECAVTSAILPAENIEQVKARIHKGVEAVWSLLISLLSTPQSTPFFPDQLQSSREP